MDATTTLEQVIEEETAIEEKEEDKELLEVDLDMFSTGSLVEGFSGSTGSLVEGRRAGEEDHHSFYTTTLN